MPYKNSGEKLDNKSKEISQIPIQGDRNKGEKRDSKDYFKTFYTQEFQEQKKRNEAKMTTEVLIDNVLTDKVNL